MTFRQKLLACGMAVLVLLGVLAGVALLLGIKFPIIWVTSDDPQLDKTDELVLSMQAGNEFPVNIRINSVDPQLDDTDKLAVSLYGADAAPGDTALALDNAGRIAISSMPAVTVTNWGQAALSMTLGSEIVSVNATGQGDVPVSLGGETVTVTVTDGSNELDVAVEDTVAATKGIQMMGRYSATVGAVNDGDATLILTDEAGRPRVWLDSKLDPVNDVVGIISNQGDITVTLDNETVDIAASGIISRTAITATAAGDNIMILGLPGVSVKVLHLLLISDGAVHIQITDGFGGPALTGNMPLPVAGSGFVLAPTFPKYHWLEASIYETMTLRLSDAVTVTGCAVFFRE